MLHRYNDLTFERFWKRELDIEDPGVVGAVLRESGRRYERLFSLYGKEGREEVDRICRDAEALGVFGVPSFRST